VKPGDAGIVGSLRDASLAEKASGPKGVGNNKMKSHQRFVPTDA
jgi:hypothetical protein